MTCPRATPAPANAVDSRLRGNDDLCEGAGGASRLDSRLRGNDEGLYATRARWVTRAEHLGRVRSHTGSIKGILDAHAQLTGASLMDAVSTIALTMGSAWASGINLYATVFVLGYLNNSGALHLPPELAYLSHPLVLIIAGALYCLEFLADKVPGLDSVWDGLHTFIRIPAGAILAAQSLGDVSQATELGALLLGGSLVASSHALKAGSRVLINTSPEPFTNWAASISEDVLVVAGLWTALHHPLLFLIGLAVFIALLLWLLPKLWRAIKQVFSWIGRQISGNPPPPPPPPPV